MPRLSDADLARLRELERAATPGPWGSTGHGDIHALGLADRPRLYEATPDWYGQWGHNTSYVIALVNAAPSLLAELAAARAVVAAARQRAELEEYAYAVESVGDHQAANAAAQALAWAAHALADALAAYAALEGQGDG